MTTQETADKTRILYLITKGNFGGAQRYVYDLATSLPRDSFNVTVAYGEGSELARRLDEHNIPTLCLRSLKRDVGLFDFSALIETYRLLKQHQPDVIHLNSSKIGFIGALAARAFNVRQRLRRTLRNTPNTGAHIIFTAHGWAYNDARYSAFVRFLFRLLQWATVLLSHTTVAVSEAIRASMARLPFTSPRMVVVHNAIPDFERLERDAAREQLCADTSLPTWIGTTSELVENKGLDVAVEAFARIAGDFPDTAFVILGEGEQREELERRIASHNLTNRVFLCGYVPHAPRYLEAFDVFTLTSRTEAFAYALLETAHAELPVIASRVGGVPEIIEDSTSGILVRPNDVRDAESALRYMLEHPEQRAAFAKQLRATVRKRFTPQNMIRQMTSLYTT